MSEELCEDCPELDEQGHCDLSPMVCAKLPNIRAALAALQERVKEFVDAAGWMINNVIDARDGTVTFKSDHYELLREAYKAALKEGGE